MKLVTVKLPDDLEKKLAELKGERSINAVICEALRWQWLPNPEEQALLDKLVKIIEEEDALSESPVFGSIPAEQRK
jgi:hypothetical protein